MEYTQCQEFSYFLSHENDLKSVEEYFNPRPAEGEGDEDEDCSDYSSDEYEFDHETDSDIDKKWRTLLAKHVDVVLAITEIHAALLLN